MTSLPSKQHYGSIERKRPSWWNGAVTALDFLFSELGSRPFDVFLRGQRVFDRDEGSRLTFSLSFSDPEKLCEYILHHKEVSLMAACMRGDLEIEGDAIEAALVSRALLSKGNPFLDNEHMEFLIGDMPGGYQNTKRAPPSIQLKNGKMRSPTDEDLAPECLTLWRGTFLYDSSAYFANRFEDLDAAQVQKSDYILRKLDLKEDDLLLDVDCGWGSFMLYAAEKHGAHVRGITTSARQAEYVNQRINASGLRSRSAVFHMNYQDLDGPERYNKIVFLDRLENQALCQNPEFYRKMSGLLKPGGIFLNSQISGTSDDSSAKPYQYAGSFGFEIRDVENLRDHYDLTIQRWLQRLAAAKDEFCAMTDEQIYRSWRFHLAEVAAAFRSGDLTVSQVQYVKPDDNGHVCLPLSRRDWYI